ncbi:hypothetical protein NG895_06510 [Aeoliella sp. ICT_H6.2]|uniref:PEP-CTERM protein-sorting domain-containing protein n=1 Tax=Aeoliella straminimaris TaxID=2954799 RepID=A0A9X2JF07_9BACT|nr:hypothetical protein [Aeoliella straminimaris]MCO6043555.1 hypothetical protein [Aeoliella straminimaris]
MATVRLGTGEFRLTNIGVSNYTLVAYSISQPAPELQVDQWLHVAGLRDTSGDGSVDGTGTWVVIQPEEVMGELPATSDELIEGALTGTGGVLGPGDYLYLGAIWDTDSLRNLQVLAAKQGDSLASIDISYVPTGDYNEDGLVDGDDYALWKDSFGQSGTGLLADGNADEEVDLADYVVWRNNLGAVALAPQSAILPIAASLSIPEPGAVVLSLALLAVGLGGWRRAGG